MNELFKWINEYYHFRLPLRFSFVSLLFDDSKSERDAILFHNKKNFNERAANTRITGGTTDK